MPTTMCIIHKGFRGFRAASSASNFGGSLIGLNPETRTKSYTQPLSATMAILKYNIMTMQKEIHYLNVGQSWGIVGLAILSMLLFSPVTLICAGAVL